MTEKWTVRRNGFGTFHTIRDQNGDLVAYVPDYKRAVLIARLPRAFLTLELLADSGGDAHQIDECIKAAQALLEQSK